ncbi:MAG: hypothetical protein A2066_02640 [Bacteroidetes bacterium GWB2_41_8]|nr:MAG: hypothetical protein A2066_02640 [Bacteroidetes bacterium GWB2_41_8]
MKTRILTLLVFSIALILNSCTKDDEPANPPVVTATPSTQTISSGSATSITISSSTVGTTFTWTVVQTGVSGGSSGSGSSITQTLATTGTVAGTATYTITPTANGVSGAAINVTVTVNPVAVTVKTTYTADIKPLLVNSCTPCHISGGSNPNKWDNYATTKSKINGILDRVQRETTAAGFMPQGGSKLSAANIALLKKWVDDGLLEN